MIPEESFSPDGEVIIAASVATGLENVAAEEIAEKVVQRPSKEAVITKQGRVYFTTTKERLASMHSLRSVDRLFLIARTCENYSYKETKEATLADLTTLANELQWSEIIKFWFYNMQYCKGKWRQEDLGRKFHSRKNKQSENEIVSKQPTLHNSDSSSAETDSLKKDSPSPKRHKCDSDGDDKQNEMLVSDSNTSKTSRDYDICTEHPTNGTESLIPRVAPDGTLIRFRVSTNRVGKKQPITSPEASRQFGGIIQDKTQWKVDLSNYNLEIMLCLGQSSLEVGIALTLQSLHRRNITHFGMTTLRATTAYCMLRLCDIKSGDVVIDPMCGSGAIPIEGGLEWPDGFHIGGDNTKASVTRCNNNIIHLNENPDFAVKYTDDSSHRRKNFPADVMRWDVTELPLRTSCADVIVSDLPFGKRVGSKTDNRKLYPALLKELARVARPQTGRACLLTQDKRTIIRALDSLKELWKVKKTLYINIGGLTAGVFLLKRTGNNILFENTKV